MQGLPFKVLAFLLLGAIANIAVAWGCSYYILPRFGGASTMPAPDFGLESLTEPLPVAQWEGFGVTEVDQYLLSGQVNGASEIANQVNEIMQDNNPNDDPVDGVRLRQQLHEIANQGYLTLRTDAGWPLRSCRGWTSVALRTSQARPGTWLVSDESCAFAFAMARDVRGMACRRALPWHPLWPGFAINTFFYAGLSWLLFAAGFALRRRRRLHRGLCPACAYPVGVSDRCTECGSPLPARLISGEPAPPAAQRTAL